MCSFVLSLAKRQSPKFEEVVASSFSSAVFRTAKNSSQELRYLLCEPPIDFVWLRTGFMKEFGLGCEPTHGPASKIRRGVQQCSKLLQAESVILIGARWANFSILVTLPSHAFLQESVEPITRSFICHPRVYLQRNLVEVIAYVEIVIERLERGAISFETQDSLDPAKPSWL